MPKMKLKLTGRITDKAGIAFSFTEENVTKMEIEDGDKRLYYEVNEISIKIAERIKALENDIQEYNRIQQDASDMISEKEFLEELVKLL